MGGSLWTVRVACGRATRWRLGTWSWRYPGGGGGAAAVAVVGLLHVNGILRRWEAANAEWEAARAADRLPAAAPLQGDGGGVAGGGRT